jgi:hypothetical protein
MFHALIDFILVFISIPFCSVPLHSIRFEFHVGGGGGGNNVSTAQHPQNGYSQLI